MLNGKGKGKEGRRTGGGGQGGGLGLDMAVKEGKVEVREKVMDVVGEGSKRRGVGVGPGMT